MTINLKNNDFSFSATFSKKIENLERILQFDINDPIKAVQNLNNIYNDYQAYLSIKNKNNAVDAKKKIIKNYLMIIKRMNLMIYQKMKR